MKKYLPILFLVIFLAPSVVLASWWNPFTWKIFKKKEPIPQVQFLNTEKEKTPEEKIIELQKQLDELKTQNTQVKKEATKGIELPVSKVSIFSKVKNVINSTVQKEEVTKEEVKIVFDVCKNIDGIQDIAPDGMRADNGNCSKVDLCPYLAYDQFTLPVGMVRDSDGKCYYPSDDFCPNIPGFQNQLPDEYNQLSFRGDCYKLEAKNSTEILTLLDNGIIDCYGGYSAGNTHNVNINCRNTYSKTNAELKSLRLNFKGNVTVFVDNFPIYDGYAFDKTIDLSGKISANATNQNILTISSRTAGIDGISLLININGVEKNMNFVWESSLNRYIVR